MNIPVGELSCQRTVLSTNCPVGELSADELSFGELSVGEVSVYPLAMVHGKPRHAQSQGSVERANGDTNNMLLGWMSDNSTQNWSLGLKFVHQYKNCSLHAGKLECG